MQPINRVLNQTQHKRKILLGLTFVPLAFFSTYMISSYFSLSERFTAWASNYEEIAEIDELPIALLASLMAMVWFATQRIAESRELIKRNTALLQQVLEVQEAERKSIARNLHDDLGQYLNAIKAEAASLCMGDSINSDIFATAQRITQNTNHAYNATKLMMHTLRPVGLDELGLSAAIEHLVDQWNTAFQSNTIIKLAIHGNIDNLGESLNIAIFRIVQEGITNIAKHAKAKEINIQLTISQKLFRVELSDNGIGFDTENPNVGYGLLGMSERVEALSGELIIYSAFKQGTRLTAEIPIN
ncbi:MAG TPA: sensor histidine kinase [Methylotenera sp.]|nr:sensor histidine kinase [Methylotenera sp.]HPN02080.1 sensor histidine kinase [Methylotenera sp.]